jgi:hypothetical protein
MTVIYYYDRNAIERTMAGRGNPGGPLAGSQRVRKRRMRYDKGHKDATRQRIIDVASRQFREQGVAAVGPGSWPTPG